MPSFPLFNPCTLARGPPIKSGKGFARCKGYLALEVVAKVPCTHNLNKSKALYHPRKGAWVRTSRGGIQSRDAWECEGH
jgi:hypothetical protein